MKIFLTVFLVLLGCSHQKQEEIDQKRILALESWKGHSTSELLKHHYFGHLPVKKVKHDDGLETWVFRDQTRYQSSAYCQSLGGCTGIPFYQCDNAFTVKDDLILEFKQNGSCPPVGAIEVEKKSKE